MKIADLQEAKNSNDRKFLAEQFQAAAKSIQAGGSVTVEREFSNGSLEVDQLIDNLEDLKRLEKRYLP